MGENARERVLLLFMTGEQWRVFWITMARLSPLTPSHLHTVDVSSTSGSPDVSGANFTNWTQDGSHIAGEHFICSGLHYIIMKEMVKKIKVYPSMWDMYRNEYLLLVLGDIIKKKHLIYGWNSLNMQFYPNIQKVNFDYLFSYFLIHTLET